MNRPTDYSENKPVEALLLGFIIMAFSLAAFAQGKVMFGNDSNHLITWGDLWPPWTQPDCGDFIGMPVSQVGSSNLCNLGLFTAELLAGTSWSSLAVVSTVNAGAPGLPDGRIPNTPLTLNGIPPGVPAYFQMRIYAGRSYGDNDFRGASSIFTVVPGALAYVPIFSSTSSTWQNGPVLISTCMSGELYLSGQPDDQTVIRGANALFSVRVLACPSAQYQWLFNGTAIPGATNSTYVVTNAGPSNMGTYCVRVGNLWKDPSGWHSVTSSNATLTVLVPPAIISTPLTQTAEAGAKVVFGVRAEGDSPLLLQWFFNGAQALGAASTNSSLELTDVQPAQAGAYTVVVTNPYGAVTSPPALLSVIPAVDRKLIPAIKATGHAPAPLNVDHASTLIPLPQWTTFLVVDLTNSPQFFFDLSDPFPPQRFYRAWQSNMVGELIILDPHLVPAIKLSGAVGTTLRLDYINQFGPTNSWVPLATNTLTTTSQLYFDTSSIGQPPRLYRVTTAP